MALIEEDVGDRARPLISVVTATFNAVEALPWTARSLRAQRYKNFEWLVADGASSDGTIEAIQENADLIAWWDSQKDGGIYDAWNKACKHIQGEWVLFLGAGDELASPDALSVISEALLSCSDETLAVYGQLELISQEQRQALEILGAPWKEYAGRWEIGRPVLPPHGATFQRASLLRRESPFDTSYRIVADSKQLLPVVKSQPPLFVASVLTRAPIGGVSFNFSTASQVASELRRMNRELAIVPPMLHRIGDRCRLALIACLNRLPTKVAFFIADVLLESMGRKPRWNIR